MKKLLTIIALAISAMTVMAEEFKIGKLTFEITSPTEVRLLNAADDITTVNLDKTIDYQGKMYTVTSIGDRAFYYCSSLTSVTIPNSVTSIGDFAFFGCESLSSPIYNIHCFAFMPTSYSGAYTIPNSIRQIAGGAFWDCSSLKSVTIPNSVTSIEEGAFSSCSSLTSVTIPNSVMSIGDCAFSDCSSLTSVTIPNSVTSIGYGAFWGCSSLTSVTIPNSVTNIGYKAFSGCTGLTSITIPNSVTSIGRWAFEDCSSLTSIAIPNSVTSIAGLAFEDCSSLTSVTIPNSVTWIGTGAFSGCEALTKLNYNGMQAQWKQIEKDGDWMEGSSIELIHCLDVMIVMTKEDDIVELEDEIFMIVETMPEFPGGQQAMMKFIAENVQYPANATEKGGRVVCQFVVEKDGRVSNIQVIRSSGDASLDKEAVRVIGTMPKWKPGIQRGKPVRVTFTLPISFRLSDEPKESTKP